MSRTVHRQGDDMTNVIPFPTKAERAEWTHRWPKSLFPPGQHPVDAEPAPKLTPKRAPKRPRSAAEEEKRALFRALVWEISAMMQDPNSPLRGDRA